jgi:lysophospholipase L1-like esterase
LVKSHVLSRAKRCLATTAPVAAIVALVLTGVAPMTARAETASEACKVPFDVVRFPAPLSHLSKKISTGEPVTIVAIGSSSTSGSGASSPAATYPSRLQEELKTLFPRQKFTVFNRGVGGEEIGDMLKRFDTAVLAEKPDLVLWQLGTNSVIRDHGLLDHGAMIRFGLNMIRTRLQSDIVLIDPQFAPKVIAKPDAEKMVRLIGKTAKTEDVGLFHRFDVMRYWHDTDKFSFDKFVSPDGLHMNDWSYGCVAKLLAAAIAEASTRPVSSASASPAR